MKKILSILLLSLFVLFIIGCGSSSDRKLVSKPVQTNHVGQSADVQSSDENVKSSDESSSPDTSDSEASTGVAEEPVARPSDSSLAFCEQVSQTKLGELMGGEWIKLSDCPQRPQMPAGVTICTCAYDGPKQAYVNVEVQKYADANEALRVFNMYCNNQSNAAGVGTFSCTDERSTPTGPNYVFFNQASSFVKVSCLGATCPFSRITEVAKVVEADI
jgi:hypothetical protein